jgi:hypothetical protein
MGAKSGEKGTTSLLLKERFPHNQWQQRRQGSESVETRQNQQHQQRMEYRSALTPCSYSFGAECFVSEKLSARALVCLFPLGQLAEQLLLTPLAPPSFTTDL